ncbi:MAG: efflux RND transporter periplasmic adaptor subunit, partial [Pseudomonadota bacterium]|nr:efflux RND transporter periplasmic adaptor subunit [Pseudomonadota bacterium]
TPRVGVTTIAASMRSATITLRGRTQSLHSVQVRAEVEGVVNAIHFEKGDKVKAGQVLCEIKLNDRGAKLDQARALVAQTRKQHDVDLELKKDGFRSATQVAASEAQYEAALAAERTQEIQLANTKIRAPFAGYIDDRYVDVGDYMRVGDNCALLIAPEPFLAVGQVSEDDVGEIHAGDPASATLVSGENVEGQVRFVANKADSATRTFRVEVQLPNPDNKLRDGVSADIHIPVKRLKAQKISPGILVLDDAGVVGVRTVQNGVVQFLPVRIVSDGPAGMWVSGLPDKVTIITVGQEFVTNGEHVQAVPEKADRNTGHAS